jgi:hypothetical protein
MPDDAAEGLELHRGPSRLLSLPILTLPRRVAWRKLRGTRLSQTNGFEPTPTFSFVKKSVHREGAVGDNFRVDSRSTPLY